jgi:hypothetical protein
MLALQAMRAAPSVTQSVAGGVSSNYNSYINDGKQFAQWLPYASPGFTNRLLTFNAEL